VLGEVSVALDVDQQGSSRAKQQSAIRCGFRQHSCRELHRQPGFGDARSRSPGRHSSARDCGRKRPVPVPVPRCVYCAAVRGTMFLLIRKRFSGSQRAFTAARRSKFGPNAARTRSSPSSALRKLR
jgi:hypothetical protein